MKVNYELTLEDCNIYIKETFFIKRFFQYFIKNNIRRALILSILLSLLLSYLHYTLSLMSIITLFIGIFLFVYIIWGLIGYFSGGKNVYGLLEGLDKNYELTVENDVIKRTSTSGESSYTWNNVKDIYNTKRNILIFVSERQAIVVPKRIFSNEQEANAFWTFVSSCYKTTNEKSV